MCHFESRDHVLEAEPTCQSALMAHADALLADYATAEDVAQDAFLVVARKHKNSAEGSLMLARCREIVRLEIMSHLGKRRCEPAVEDYILNDAMGAALEMLRTKQQLRECVTIPLSHLYRRPTQRA